MLATLRRLNEALVRGCVRGLARPTVHGAAPLPDGEVVYALHSASLSDVALLGCVAEREGWPMPTAPLPDFDEPRRYFFLNRPVGLWRRKTMRALPERLLRLEKTITQGATPLLLVPVSIFWGRAANKDRSWLRALFSEGWAASSRLRRLLILTCNRHDILVQFGTPLPWRDMVVDERHTPRRTARLLRVKFRNQKVAALGPDLSHRRTLVTGILRSAQVNRAIDAHAEPGRRKVAERLARKAALGIAADLSYPTVRFLEVLLTWFWRHIYEGVEVHGIDRLAAVAQTHTLVYTPCHRSHIDYLLLSYILYHNGFMLPHVASGDNLNLPVVGGMLRRGGAFFLRRSFQGDRIYAAVFAEYMYQVFRRGHSVEYFVEGSRSRTGRMLPARVGLLQMTIDAHHRGVPRPLAIVPVYIGYEKLIEAAAYVDEMRGADKKRESVGGILRSAKLVRQAFGKVQLVFGEPFALGDFLDGLEQPADAVRSLGAKIVAEINACVAVNGINLIALATLSMPRQAIDEQALEAQIDLYRQLIRRSATARRCHVVDAPAAEIVAHAEAIGMLDRERSASGSDAGGDVISHDAFASVLMTWYRNNVLHLLAAPALIACLVVNRRRGLSREDLQALFDAVFPYVLGELQGPPTDSADHWLEHLQEVSLIELRSQGFMPSRNPVLRFRLRLLAYAVMPVLEGFYICVSLLARAGSGVLDSAALLADGLAAAQRISRLYRINAPEFADARLFARFVDRLIDSGVVEVNDEGKLLFDERIRRVVRAGRGVIADEVRQDLERPAAARAR